MMDGSSEGSGSELSSLRSMNRVQVLSNDDQTSSKAAAFTLRNQMTVSKGNLGLKALRLQWLTLQQVDQSFLVGKSFQQQLASSQMGRFSDASSIDNGELLSFRRDANSSSPDPSYPCSITRFDKASSMNKVGPGCAASVSLHMNSGPTASHGSKFPFIKCRAPCGDS